jgi:preprotein translocase subunit SecA
MDYLKEGIGLRAMAQRDPLVEYQREGFSMFQQMMGGIREESVQFLFNIEIQTQQPAAAQPEQLTYSAPNEDGAAEVHQEHNSAADAQGSATQKPQQGEKGSSFFRN